MCERHIFDNNRFVDRITRLNLCGGRRRAAVGITNSRLTLKYRTKGGGSRKEVIQLMEGNGMVKQWKSGKGWRGEIQMQAGWNWSGGRKGSMSKEITKHSRKEYRGKDVRWNFWGTIAWIIWILSIWWYDKSLKNVLRERIYRDFIELLSNSIKVIRIIVMIITKITKLKRFYNYEEIYAFAFMKRNN